MPKNVAPSPLFYLNHPDLVPALHNLRLILLPDISRLEQVASHVGCIPTGRVPNHIDKLLEITQGRGGRTDLFLASTW